jgi:hypothetical protein
MSGNKNMKAAKATHLTGFLSITEQRPREPHASFIIKNHPGL